MMGKALLRLGCFLMLFVSSSFELFAAQDAPQNALTPATTRAVGTISSIAGQTITLKTDAGAEAEVVVTVTDSTKLLQLKPGQKDLKEATPLSLSDLKTGDRILVRGAASADGKQLQAASVIAMKQTDIADKQTRDRAEWQRNGVGGLVKSVDPASGTISIATNSAGTSKEISIHTSKSTVLRRYAPDSIKFDDAKLAPLSEIKPGDQLRARGQKTADGNELTADEIVSGTFRSIAGILVSTDAAAGTITVTDLATKQPVTLRVSADSQLRKLQPFLAQGIAMHLKAAAAEGTAAPNAGQAATPPAGGAPRGGPGSGGPGGGSGRGGGGGGVQPV